VTTPASGHSYSFDNGLTFQSSRVKDSLPLNTAFLIKVRSNTTGCISDVASLSIGGLPANPAAPVATVSKTPTCTLPFGTITVTTPASGHSYSFDNGNSYQASRVKNNLAPGTYLLKVKYNTSGCISDDTSITIDSATCIDLLSQSPVPQISSSKHKFLNSAHDKNESKSMLIYPNPAHDYVNIDLNYASFPGEKVSLRIINSMGKIVKEMTAGINATIKIDTKDLSSGIYLVQCYNRGELVNVKQLLVR
jgi:hypothetical protein